MNKLNIISNVDELRKEILHFKNKKKSIGFVPTLGGLHNAHLELIRYAKKRSDVIVVSIFLNPIQFNKKKDYNSYPKDISKDKKKIKGEKINIVYIPDLKQVFPYKKIDKIKASRSSIPLCGKYRKGHFDGVVTVLKVFFDQIQPDKLFMGEKDFQQIKVVEDLIKKYRIQTKIISHPTVRNKHGLALSSRNSLLEKKKEKIAANLFRILTIISKKFTRDKKKDRKLISWGKKELLNNGFTKVDYIEILDEKSLSKNFKNKGKFRVFGAAYLDKIRLIDNVSIKD